MTPEPPLLRPVWIVGVLGHRTLAKPREVEAALECELRKILAATERRGGELHIQTSAAAGTDLLAIRAARRLDLPVHVVLPLEKDEFFQDFAGFPRELAEARAAIDEARGRRHRDSVRVALTTGSRPACYFDTDIRIVESSDLLLTVWDGAGTEQLGGTGQIAAMARDLGKPSVVIHPNTLTVATESHEPDAWPPPEQQWDWMARGNIFSGAATTLGKPATDSDRARKIKSRLSQSAGAGAFDFRRTAQRQILVEASAGIVGLVAGIIAAHIPRIAAAGLYAVQLVLVLWVLRTRWQLKRHALVSQWTNARIGAEIWRGLERSLPMADPLRPIASYLVPEWRRFALSLGLLINRYRQPHFASDSAGLDAFKAEYMRERLTDQRLYFTRELERSAKWVAYLPAVARHCSQWVPFFTILAMVNLIFDFSWTGSALGLVSLTILPAVLPLTASTADGMVSTLDHKRRSNTFKATVAALTLLELELPHLRTEDSVRNLVRRAEEILLAEQVEWRAATRELKV